MNEARSAASATVDAREASHFGKLAAQWWDPAGSSAMLHRLNPPRLAYLRREVDAHWAGDGTDFTPLAGKRILDMGCGAGLLAEPLARLGGTVTGIDAAPEVIAAARVHAEAGGLAIDYRVGGTEAIGGDKIDLIVSFEVIEHVPSPQAFVRALAAALASGGLLLLSTPNRTALSRAAMIGIAEGTGRIPRGTHDWNKFLTPDELTSFLVDAGLQVGGVQGLAWSPGGGFHLSDSTALDYFVSATRA